MEFHVVTMRFCTSGTHYLQLDRERKIVGWVTSITEASQFVKLTDAEEYFNVILEYMSSGRHTRVAINPFSRFTATQFTMAEVAVERVPYQLHLCRKSHAKLAMSLGQTKLRQVAGRA